MDCTVWGSVDKLDSVHVDACTGDNPVRGGGGGRADIIGLREDGGSREI